MSVEYDGRGTALPPPALADLAARLRATGRGKHIHPFSYYHRALIDTAPGASEAVRELRSRLGLADRAFNVVKLDVSNRISFLLYEPFEVRFPALLAAASCDLARGTVRRVDHSERPNPPILHRKELLLPAGHPQVPDAARVTERLELAGAFRPSNTIGTRAGWQRRLRGLGLDESGRPLR